MKTQEQKNELLKELLAHQIADRFIQGQWFDQETQKGCFYGCTMKTEENPREAFSKKYDIDLWYCYLTEKIFEGLPKKEALKFPYNSIKIIPLNFDFNVVKSSFNRKMLLKQLEWVKDEKCINAIKLCADLFLVPFNKIDKSAAESAALSAESAESAESAALSAEYAALSAEYAARSVAWSARSAAESARSAALSARSAARSAALSARSAALSARSAARSAALSAESAESAAWSAKTSHYIWLRDTLFECIKTNSLCHT
jgi:hypothetical protein